MKRAAEAMLVQRRLDGELRPADRLRLWWHLRRCAACRTELGRLQALRGAIRAGVPAFHAPASLAGRITAALDAEAEPAAVPPRRSARVIQFGGSALAGALAGAALMVLLVAPRPAPPGAALRALLDAHVRSLMAEHLTDVATSDRHTVKPWLSRRLDVSPPAPELAPEGFPLLGGRLDYVDGHPAAVVVYRRRAHVINVFAWAVPDRGDRGFSQASDQGFNVVRWQRNGVALAAVSDLDREELMQMARLLAGAP